jgi:clan AA aspartic protease
MITGVVTAYEARIQILVKGPTGQEQEVDAVVDTGYTASLTLPSSLVESLNLHWQSVGRGTLADGSVCLFDVYEAEVVWDGQVRRLLVDEADTDPLVGMTLLSGFELRMEVRSQGKLEITRLLT